jgi:hypothetical protein
MTVQTLVAFLTRLFRFIVSHHFIELGLRIEHVMLFTWFLWEELPKGVRTFLVTILSFVTANGLQALLGGLVLLALYLSFRLGRRLQARSRRREAEARAAAKLKKEEIAALKALTEAIGTDRPKDRKPKPDRKGKSAEISEKAVAVKAPPRPRKRAP